MALRGFRRRRGRPGVWMRVSAVLAALLLLLAMLAVRCRPIVTEFATSSALWLAEQTANAALAQVLADNADLCDTMVKVSYNDRQILSGITVDTAAVNTIKTAVSNTVMQRMEEVSTVVTEIPLGTLIGLSWFSGCGPLLRFPIGVTCSVLSTVSSELHAVGMNQSTYQLIIHVKIGLLCVTPGGREHVSTTVAFPMAEAVLLGEVPDALTEVNGDTQDTAGRIFDYGAQIDG